jgi:hypothetical protein
MAAASPAPPSSPGCSTGGVRQAAVTDLQHTSSAGSDNSTGRCQRLSGRDVRTDGASQQPVPAVQAGGAPEADAWPSILPTLLATQQSVKQLLLCGWSDVPVLVRVLQNKGRQPWQQTTQSA